MFHSIKQNNVQIGRTKTGFYRLKEAQRNPKQMNWSFWEKINK